MRPRFLLAIMDTPAAEGTAARLARATGLRIALDEHPILALVNPACRCLVVAQGSVVLGTLFHRHGPARAIEQLNGNDRARLVAGGADALLKSFWGGYVATVGEAGGTHVLRDPSGALACYHGRGASAAFFASDVELLMESGAVSPTIDWQALARHLHAGGLPVPETALTGIFELLPGFAMAMNDRDSGQHPRWSPWDYVRPAERRPSEVAEHLRRIVHQCVLGWTASHSRLLASVSGGLDSSIVAACLARAGRDVHCLTLFDGNDPSGDERVHARSLCNHLDLPLVEGAYRLEQIDIEAPLGGHLPRPIGRTHDHAYERAHLQLCRHLGAGAFVTGNGGDNVFGYSQSAAAVADRFIQEGLSAGVVRTLGDVCRQTGCGPLAAVRAAIRTGRRRRYRWRPTPALLHPEVQDAMPEDLAHAWLDAPAATAALPGKAGHIAALLRAQQTLEPGRSRHAPVLNPLLSQPLVEACLAIPSWEWRAGGIDRAVARHAFARDLPDSILRRRVKGGPDGFCAEIIRHHRPRIRVRLLDGRLANHRLIDREAVDVLLGGARPIPGEMQVRILDLLDTEAWLDSWSARLAAITPPVAPGAATPPNA